MKPIKITAATAAAASAAYCALRDDSGEGASTFPNGIWNGHKISYNGRVWRADGLAIFNPGGETPDIWIDSTAPEAR